MLMKSNGLPLRVPILPGTKEFTPCRPHVGRHVVESEFRPPFLFILINDYFTHAQVFTYYNVYNNYIDNKVK